MLQVHRRFFFNGKVTLSLIWGYMGEESSYALVTHPCIYEKGISGPGL